MNGQSQDKKVFRLQGLSFLEELSGVHVDFGQSTVYLGLVPWEFCNWACRVCHEDRRQKESGELTAAEMVRIVSQAADLGIRTLLLLGGEVLLRSTWRTTQVVVEAAFRRGLITVIYTNGSQLTYDMAAWLAEKDVSIALKLDSLVPEKYDSLMGVKGSFDCTMRAIDLVRRTPIGRVVAENDNEKLVRFLLTTVGNSWNVDEYASLARYATEHGARWMMEALNHRGDVLENPELAIDTKTHAEAMRIAMALNPEQKHTFEKPCRLLSCITVRKKGEIAICPQDYCFVGNIRECGSLDGAVKLIHERIRQEGFRKNWTGKCPIKQAELAYA